MKKSVTRFMLKACAVAVVPLIPLVIVYAVFDPFKALRHYDNYFMPDRPARIHVNKGLASVSTIMSRMDSMRYDSFIFGSSISCYYTTDDWRRYLPAGSSPVHFDSSSEGTQSMRRKLEFLDRQGIRIANALIVLDPLIMEMPNDDDGFLCMDPPAIAGPLQYPRWHYTMFATFLSGDFLRSYIPYLLTGTPRTYGRNPIFEPQPIVYDPYVNEESIPSWDDSITNNQAEFYTRHRLIPPRERTPRCTTPGRIDPEREADFRRIMEILRRHGSSVKVIVGANIHKDTLSRADRDRLTAIFGKENVADLSAPMMPMADADSNFYDNTHYRAPAAAEMMRRAYAPRH